MLVLYAKTINVLLCFKGAAVFCIITRLILTENQFQGKCAEVKTPSNHDSGPCYWLLVSYIFKATLSTTSDPQAGKFLLLIQELRPPVQSFSSGYPRLKMYDLQTHWHFSNHFSFSFFILFSFLLIFQWMSYMFLFVSFYCIIVLKLH